MTPASGRSAPAPSARGAAGPAGLATVPGFAPLPAAQAALLGARDLDPGERELIARTGLLLLSPGRLESADGRAALTGLGQRVQRLHVHLDLDALDPGIIRGNHLPVPGGLGPREIVAAAAVALREAPLGAVSVGSYDPVEDDPAAGPRVVGEILGGLLAAG